MKYAPVIIPTLNRVNHLKRCLDSLANNYFAKETMLLISVDYPPSSKYENGYNDVLNLLKEYDFSPFLDCRVFYQQTNLGPFANFEFLVKEVSKISDRYISTEDDNEFSPCFLEYVNEGLEMYKNNDDIIAVCGGKNPDFIFEDGCNVIFSKRFFPYGVGSWLSKNKLLENECRRVLLGSGYYHNLKTLFKRDRGLFTTYVLSILCSDSGIYWKSPSQLRLIDSCLSIYMNVTERLCVCPVLSKSRTFGNDGSGYNMKASKDNGSLIIDKSERFEIYAPKSIIFNESNYKIGAEYLRRKSHSSKAFILAMFLSVILLLFMGNRRVVIWLFNQIKKHGQ